MVSLAEFIQRGATLEDLLNFQALELLEPAADTQMMRGFTRLAASIEQMIVLLTGLVNPKARYRPRWNTQADLFPSPLDEINESDPEFVAEREQRTLARLRRSVAERLKTFVKPEEIEKR